MLPRVISASLAAAQCVFTGGPRPLRSLSALVAAPSSTACARRTPQLHPPGAAGLHAMPCATSTHCTTPSQPEGETSQGAGRHEPMQQAQSASASPPGAAGTALTTSEMRAAAAGGFSTGVTTTPTGQGFRRTFYKRNLPSPPSIAFASAEGKQLFAEALAAGHMSGFFKLMEQFSTQDEPSFCGLASLAMVLNALAIDPRRTWKGAWRWFHEQMLDCCRPLEDVKREGITLPQAACLARCNGARVTLHHYGTFTEDDLRRQVIDVCTTGEQHLVVSYSRRGFLQTGDGHFSPVGGYHAARDLVLILDVARFKYPPHWVPLPLLFDAMKYVDKVTGQARGFLRVSAQPLLGSVLMTLDVRSSVWRQANAWVRTTVPEVVQAAASLPSVAMPALMRQLLAGLPLDSLEAFLMERHNSLPTTGSGGSGGTSSPGGTTAGGRCSSGSKLCDGAAGGCLPVEARQQLLAELRALPLFSVVQAEMQATGMLVACTALRCQHASHTGGVASSAAADSEPRDEEVAGGPGHGNSGLLAEKVTLLLLLQRRDQWPTAWRDEAAGQAWAALTDTTGMTIVEAELAFLREQFSYIEEAVAGDSLEPTCGSGCYQKLDCMVLKC